MPLLVLGILYLWGVVGDGPANTASADTGIPGYVTSAATPTQADVVAPNDAQTDLSGLSNGDLVTITVSGPPGQFFGMEVRQCRDMGAGEITFHSEFVPDGGNCIEAPFTLGSTDAYQSQSAAPTNTTATVTFRVGTGTQSWNAFDAGPSTVTCDDTHPCDLWIREAVPIEFNVGINWVHYDLAFAAGVSTSSTSSSSTVPSSSTTSSSSTVPSSSTSSSSTVASSTSSSSTVPSASTTSSSSTVASSSTSSSSTVASSSTTTSTLPPPTTTSSTTTAPTTTTVLPPTTTTAPPSTTTTVPPSTSSTSTSTTIAGTTTTTEGPLSVSPTTVEAGESLSVTTTGWPAEASITATLHSDPVDLGTLTADSTGKAAAALKVPVAVAPGTHKLKLVGLNAEGGPRELETTITVTKPAARTPLERTGEESVRLALSAVALMVAGTLMLIPPIRRRRLGRQ